MPLDAQTPRDLHAGYLFGVVGRIDAPCIGYVEEPDIDAFHYVDGPMQPTYRITFYQKDLWEGYQVVLSALYHAGLKIYRSGQAF